MTSLDEEPRLVAAASAVPTAVAATAARAPSLREAVRAVHRLVATGLERHQRIVAARRAGHREHLTIPPSATAIAAATAVAAAIAPAATAGATTRRSAVTATTRVVGEPTAREELLLSNREDKRLTAIAAVEDLVRVTHADTSRELGCFVSASRERDWELRKPRGRPLAACETYQRSPIYHRF